MLVGPVSHIKKAIHFRKLFGGGIRQAGILTSAANYYLDLVLPQLPRVHALAKRLGQGLAAEGASIIQPVETNMIWFDSTPLGFNTNDISDSAAAHVGMTVYSGRLVMHWQMNDETVDTFLQLIRRLKEKHKANAVPLSQLERERTEAYSKGLPFDGPVTAAEAIEGGGYGANGPR